MFVYKQKNIVVMWFTNAALNSDGKTFTFVLPSEYIPRLQVNVFSKCYNGSSYVDCKLQINTDGTITLTDLFAAKINGIQPGYFQTKPIVYLV